MSRRGGRAATDILSRTSRWLWGGATVRTAVLDDLAAAAASGDVPTSACLDELNPEGDATATTVLASLNDDDKRLRCAPT